MYLYTPTFSRWQQQQLHAAARVAFRTIRDDDEWEVSRDQSAGAGREWVMSNNVTVPAAEEKNRPLSVGVTAGRWLTVCRQFARLFDAATAAGEDETRLFLSFVQRPHPHFDEAATVLRLVRIAGDPRAVTGQVAVAAMTSWHHLCRIVETSQTWSSLEELCGGAARPTAIYNLAVAVSEGSYRSSDFKPQRVTDRLLARLEAQSDNEQARFRQAIERLTRLRSQEFPDWNTLLDRWLEQ